MSMQSLRISRIPSAWHGPRSEGGGPSPPGQGWKETAPGHGCQSKWRWELTVPHQSCLWRTNSALPTYFPLAKPQTHPSLPYITPTALRLCCKHVASTSKSSNHEQPPWSSVFAYHLSWEEIKSHLSSAPFFSMHFSFAQCTVIGEKAIY